MTARRAVSLRARVFSEVGAAGRYWVAELTRLSDGEVVSVVRQTWPAAIAYAIVWTTAGYLPRRRPGAFP